jgi:hypothetical protein
MREKYCWLVVDKSNEQGADLPAGEGFWPKRWIPNGPITGPHERLGCGPQTTHNQTSRQAVRCRVWWFSMLIMFSYY